ncbi:TonB-dependent receptor plug domain-containing protein [Dyadobacter arcticus]|uniref:Outer membrane receptor protein involved in Fe transport n=1 Tax=Dyadobacter arcticus TaxID=1078754 RepID=A0ABX0UNH4_9BACT|nr:TonB-dependent receptor [Dyadobacter arcticus]NIJ54543.1 outer membrane receptor protein involved in Fe transport [Dyadobacter arcticus]
MKVFYCCLITLSSALPGIAQTSDSLQTEMLSQVTVTANRTREKSFETAGSVSVISSQALQTYQPRTTPEVLMGATGVFVQKSTHGAGSPFLRGLTGNQTLILFDGIRLNNSTFRYGPNQYLNTIDPFTIDKIEVLRGGGSVAYGSDALGGTLQIFSFDPAFSEKPAVHGKAVARYATGEMEKTLRAGIALSGSRVAFSGGLSIRNFGDLIGGDTTGKQSPSGYKDRAFDAKLVFGLSDSWTLTLAHQSVSQKHVPLYYRYKLENFALNEFNPQKRSLSYFKLKGTTLNKLATEISLTGSWQATNEGRLSRKNGSNSLRTETDKVQTSGLIFNVQSDITEFWKASSGIEIYNDLVNSDKVDQVAGGDPVASRGLYPDDSKYLNYAIYSLHQLKLDAWQFTFGGRFNGFRIKVADEVLGNVSVKPQALVGNASISYLPQEHSNFYTSFHSGFRAPNIDDMGTLGIVDFRYELPAYDLKPETSYNFEAGYKYHSGGLALSAALFQNNLRNLITRVKVAGEKIDGIDVYRKENVERAYIRGGELEAEYVFSNYWRVYGSGAYNFGKNVTKNEPVRRIPPLNGRFGLEYRKKGWYARPEGWFADDQTRLAAGDAGDNRIPKGGTPGWVVINLMAGYDAKHFAVNAVAQNLTNKDYRTHGSGINGVGRSLWLTLTGKF